MLKLTNNWYKSSVVNSSTFTFVLNGLVNDSGFINALSLTAFDVDDENAEDNEEVEDDEDVEDDDSFKNSLIFKLLF